MKKLAHFCGIMLAATSFMFQSCDDSDGYSIGDIAVDWATVEAKDSHTYSLTGGYMGDSVACCIGFSLVAGGWRACCYRIQSVV